MTPEPTTAGDLNARHIGQPVSITFEGWEHNGSLEKVSHEAGWLRGGINCWVSVNQPDGSRWHAQVPADTPVSLTGPRTVTR